MRVFALAMCALIATPLLVAGDAEADRTITKVVKLLQEMLEKSQQAGKQEREMFAKFQCYCDTNKAEKEKSIEELTKTIADLEAEIEELQASTGGLSIEVADLDKKMAENEEARQQATALREKEHEDFLAEEADMSAAIGQMKEAIEVLAAVGADQTMGSDAQHEKFMAADAVKNAGGAAAAAASMLSKSVKTALAAASVFLDGKQKDTMTAFLQGKAPFTGTYTAQSGEIVGILKNMMDTFKANLAEATSAEKAAKEAYDAFMKTKKEAYSIMKDMFDTKQGRMGDNDGGLATAKENLDTAKDNLAADQAFLAELEVLCAEKAKEWEKRKMVRANQEAAIAQAIAILNSDDAFESFGKVKATSTGSTGSAAAAASFMQLSSTSAGQVQTARQQAQRLLESAARRLKSLRLAKVAVAMRAGVFTKVFEMIDDILALIEKEQKADEEQKAWCDDERTKNDEMLTEKKEAITVLKGEIESLEEEIDKTKLILADTQESLKDNRESQTTMTATRQEENLEYQKNVANIVDAEGLLKKAIKVLKNYFHAHKKEALFLEEALTRTIFTPAEGAAEAPEFLQLGGVVKARSVRKHAGALLEQREEGPGDPAPAAREGPAPPEPFEEEVVMHDAGGDVIQMLEFILEETEKEETEAHETEEAAQHDYEDAMTDLKKEEEDLLAKIADTEKTLAEMAKTLEMTRVDLDATIKSKVAIERYLEKIKPGCDFITEYIEARTGARTAEKEALQQAKEILKGTPAYKAAVAKEEKEALGKCAEKCVGNMDHVECKACVAESSIPGYCAGHPDTPGC